MQKEIETPNFSNTPGFAGPVSRVGLLGENNSVCVSIEFDSEEKFILFIFHMTVHYVLMNICFCTDYENCTIDRIFFTALNPMSVNKVFCEKQPRKMGCKLKP